MLFMVIETFKEEKIPEIYGRLEEQGRLMPKGLEYIDSWIDVGLNRCFQLMKCDNADLLQEWIANWRDLMAFEVVPVVPSKETSEIVRAHMKSVTESGT